MLSRAQQTKALPELSLTENAGDAREHLHGTNPKLASKMKIVGRWEHGLSGDFSHMRFHLERDYTTGAILWSVRIQPVFLNQNINKKTKKSRGLVKIERMKTTSHSPGRLNQSLIKDWMVARWDKTQ